MIPERSKRSIISNKQVSIHHFLKRIDDTFKKRFKPSLLRQPNRPIGIIQ